MKSIGLLCVLVAGLVIGYLGPKIYNRPNSKKLQEKSFPVLEHKSMTVVAFGSCEQLSRRAQSVLEQEYGSFRLVSTTDFAHLYQTIHQCKDDEIVVLLTGADWLAHPHVLKRINEIYANPDIWVTYGNYMAYPSYQQGSSHEPLPKNLRQAPPQISCPYTFYAGLFKQISLQDFLFEGEFYPIINNKAIITPLLELAGKRYQFVPEVLCVHPDQALKQEEVGISDYICSLPAYTPASVRKIQEKRKTADLVIFSYDRPMQLFALLESVQKYVTHLGQTTVIYRSSGENYEGGYLQVKNRFPLVHFCKQGEKAEEDFKPLTLEAIFAAPSEHVVFAVDDIVLKDYVDMADCIYWMEHTGAYGFFLRLGQNTDYSYMMDQKQEIPRSVDLGSGIFAWQFGVGKCDWDYPHTVDFTVYKKSDIEPRLRKIKYRHPNEMECHWAQKADRRKIGLYYAQSKMVNIPLNLVHISGNRNMGRYDPQELLEKFKAGLKIDIAPLHQIDNNSCHVNYEVAFVER
jgi:hypothetical protein